MSSTLITILVLTCICVGLSVLAYFVEHTIIKAISYAAIAVSAVIIAVIIGIFLIPIAIIIGLGILAFKLICR